MPACFPVQTPLSFDAQAPTLASAPAYDDLYATLLRRARQQRRLLAVHWELTHRCNERCAHCYLATHKEGTPAARAAVSRELTTAEGVDLLDQMAELGVVQITFSGGEPLLRGDFFELAAHARRRRFGLRVFTNGCRLGASSAAPGAKTGGEDTDGGECARRLAALHPLTVEISIYAADAPTHDAITGVQGSWVQATTALRRLHDLGVRTVWKTPLLAANAAQVALMDRAAAELGAAFHLDPVLTARAAGELTHRRGSLALRASAAQLMQALGDLPRAAGGEQYSRSARLSSHPGPLVCSLGRSALLVDPYGMVLPCVEVRAELGSIRTRPLAAIWHDAAVWEPYLALADVAALPHCRACRTAAWCVRCHGAAANETGSLRGPSPAHCRLAQARQRMGIAVAE